MDNSSLKEEIQDLINLKTEGGYWDFKRDWYKNKADLLIDIICMANNLENRDAYIIIGVDDSAEIYGVEEVNRWNQQNIIDFIKEIKFANGCRPNVYVKSLDLENSIDVIIIKNSKNVPFYLVEDYQGVFRYHIYTRVADVNTPKVSSADYDKVEYLWKKRLGLDLSPLEKITYLLKDTKKWLPVGTDGVHSSNEYSGQYYHRQFPEFILQTKLCEDRFDKGHIDRVESDMYWMNKLPRGIHNSYIYIIDVKFHSTVLYSTLAIFADSFRFKRTLWKKKILFEDMNNKYVSYCYVEKDSIEYMLDNWLCNSHDTIAQTEEYEVVNPIDMKQSEYVINNPYDVILCFESADEHEKFKNYVVSKRTEFLESLREDRYVKESRQSMGKCLNSKYIEYLCESGQVLVQWLQSWRDN